jgi:hypothetical protein
MKGNSMGSGGSDFLDGLAEIEEPSTDVTEVELLSNWRRDGANANYPPARGRPFLPGTPRPPGSGRRPGSRNRATLLIDALEKVGDANPLEFLAQVAAGQVRATMDQRIVAARELARYLVPTLKAVELSGPDGGPIQREAVLEVRIIKTVNDAPSLLAIPIAPEPPSAPN